MKPTSAQIEAAKVAIWAEQEKGSSLQKIAEAAATAAVGVVATYENVSLGSKDSPRIVVSSGHLTIEGPIDADEEFDDEDDDKNKAMRAGLKIRKFTIERCALEVAWFRNVEKYSLDDIIARIRNLQDEP